MEEYIELINRLRQEAEFEAYLQPHSANETPKLLSEAADVIEKLSKEREKGSWTKTTMTDFGYTFPVVWCTACGNVFSTFLEDVNFCPNCGADMRGET